MRRVETAERRSRHAVHPDHRAATIEQAADLLPDDTEPVPAVGPWPALLP